MKTQFFPKKLLSPDEISVFNEILRRLYLQYKEGNFQIGIVGGGRLYLSDDGFSVKWHSAPMNPGEAHDSYKDIIVIRDEAIGFIINEEKVVNGKKDL
jgi:hypothetical protein